MPGGKEDDEVRISNPLDSSPVDDLEEAGRAARIELKAKRAAIQADVEREAEAARVAAAKAKAEREAAEGRTAEFIMLLRAIAPRAGSDERRRKLRAEMFADAKLIVGRQFRVRDYKRILAALQDPAVGLDRLAEIQTPECSIKIPECKQILASAHRGAQLQVRGAAATFYSSRIGSPAAALFLATSSSHRDFVYSGCTGLQIESKVREQLARSQTKHAKSVRDTAVEIYEGGIQNLERTIAGGADRIVGQLAELNETAAGGPGGKLDPQQVQQVRDCVEEIERFYGKAAEQRGDRKERDLKEAAVVVNIQTRIRAWLARRIANHVRDEQAAIASYSEAKSSAHWGMRFKNPKASCGCAAKMKIEKSKEGDRLSVPEKDFEYKYCGKCTDPKFGPVQQSASGRITGHLTTNTMKWVLEKRDRALMAEIDARTMQNYTAGGHGEKQHLGDVAMAWAFVFAVDQSELKKVRSPDVELYEDDAGGLIPLQAWQIINQLFLTGFHIDADIAKDQKSLIVQIGLPYQELEAEADAISIGMRLFMTKGVCGFKKELLPRFPKHKYLPHEATDIDTKLETCFTSAHRQQLTMSVLKRRTRIYPEVLMRGKKKADMLKNVKNKMKNRKEIRSHDLYGLLRAFGAYREHAEHLFGHAVHAVSKEVVEHPWLVCSKPRLEAAEDDGTAALSTRSTFDRSDLSWKDVEKTVAILEAWQATPRGSSEEFVLSLQRYMPLHDKQKLKYFEEVWGSFSLITGCNFPEALEEETTAELPLYHPHNEKVKHFALMYNPVGEIRDYFGDEIALYFAWVGMYVQCLVFPSTLGVFTFVLRLVNNESNDQDSLKIPYTIFFAIWSMSFLSSWKCRENEYKFLWGTEGHEEHEQPRPEFQGKHTVNKITGKATTEFEAPIKRMIIKILSALLSVVCILVTAFCGITATNYKYSGPQVNATDMMSAGSSSGAGADEGPDIFSVDYAKDFVLANEYMLKSSIMNLVLIVVAGAVYNQIAHWLNDVENHRTPTEYNDALIIKTFLFESLNNYMVLFYIAYFEPFYNPSAKNGMNTLFTQLTIVFTGKTVLKTFVTWTGPKRAKHKAKKTFLAHEFGWCAHAQHTTMLWRTHSSVAGGAGL